MHQMPSPISPTAIAPKVHWIRYEKVILDFDLAALYCVETRTLNQAVKRSAARFPDDFMFQLTAAETKTLEHPVLDSASSLSAIPPALRSQTVILKRGRGQHRKYLPYAFTEQGVAMLSSVLHSPRAIAVNIAIMRTFVQLRRLMDSNRDLARKIETLEQKYDKQFRVVFDAIKRLVEADAVIKSRPRREIGFHVKN